MVSKHLLVGAFTVLFTFSGASFAQDSGLYVRGDAGHSKARDGGFNNSPSTGTVQLLGEVENIDNSAVYGLGIGYQFNKAFRADVAYSVRHGYELNGNDSGSPTTEYKSNIKSDAVLLTGYYTFDMAAVKPYLGLGIGWSRNKMGTLSYTDPAFAGSAPGGTKNGFAWQFAAGVDVPLSKAFTLDVGYHYVDLGKAKIGADNNTLTAPVSATFLADGIKGSLRAQELHVGVRYRF